MRSHPKRGELDALHVLQTYTEAEARDWADAWLSVFGRNHQGSNTKRYMWHVFSFERYPCLSGVQAMEAYARQSGVEFVVLSNDRKRAVLTDTLPDAQAYWSDYYVFPLNLAWTMALTHEDGWLGPYFAQHPDYLRLNEANEHKLERFRERAAARDKGWCD